MVSRPSDITHTASTFDSGSTSPTYFWHRWQKELHTEHNKTYPGEDNVVRVADIKLSNGKTLKRPVVRLCPLPLWLNVIPFKEGNMFWRIAHSPTVIEQGEDSRFKGPPHKSVREQYCGTIVTTGLCDQYVRSIRYYLTCDLCHFSPPPSPSLSLSHLLPPQYQRRRGYRNTVVIIIIII